MQRSSLLLTGILLLTVISIGAADALLVEPLPVSPEEETASSSQPSQMEEPVETVPEAIASSSASSEAFQPLPEQEPPAPVDVTPPPTPTSALPPEGAVTKKSGLDPVTVALQRSFTAEETTQKSLLSAVVKDPSIVETRVLLMNGDRAGLIAWIETPDVKQVFMVLKDSLAALFSTQVRDLLDEMQSPPGSPPRNFLTFLDPALSEERFVFVRIRERLYEFHIAPGKEEVMYQLVEELTK